MPGHTRDLRKRKGGYTGDKPIQARWRHPLDPRVRRERSFATFREARAWLQPWPVVPPEPWRAPSAIRRLKRMMCSAPRACRAALRRVESSVCERFAPFRRGLDG